MIKNIKGTRAYDFKGEEVDNLREAHILFVDTKAAAIKLGIIERNGGFDVDCEDNDDNQIENDYPLFASAKPGIYLNTLESGDCGYDIWIDLNSYVENVNAVIDRYNENIKLIAEMR